MRITALHLQDFRNHCQTHLHLSTHLNVFVGANGAGKTSILEAIAIASLTKSFIPGNDQSLVRRGQEEYRIVVDSLSDAEIPHKLSVRFSQNERRKFTDATLKTLQPKDVVGTIPSSILTPDFKDITFGSPDDRRRFIDTILCQTSRRYMDILTEHRRLLKQRNAILTNGRLEGRLDEMMLDVVTGMLIASGAELIVRRARFFDEFIPRFNDYYQALSAGAEAVSLHYVPDSVDTDQTRLEDVALVVSQLEQSARKRRTEEIRRAITLFGPQKDDFLVMVNGGVARETASQGQHKTLLIAIKQAEFTILREQRAETPIFLLDDIFSELDRSRSSRVFSFGIQHDAQFFVTGTEESLFTHILGGFPHYHLYSVKPGGVELVSKSEGSNV